MERIRLTQRSAARNRQADSAQPETSIDLGKNRTYHKIDEYHTFEPSVNHWEPDMRHEWKEDKHDENGFGIPKMAKVYMAAKKATKLAMMLLGENADEGKLEQQARAFMRMGDKALTASIERWATCQGGKCECEGENCETAGAVEPVDACAIAKNADEEEKPAEEAPVQEAPTEEASAEAPAQEEPAEAPVKPEEAPAEAPAQEEPAEEPADVEVSDELADTEVDFDDEPADGDNGADAELESVFEDEEEEEEAPKASVQTASRKSGLKKLAGQPTLTRVASKNADELADCWSKWTDVDVR